MCIERVSLQRGLSAGTVITKETKEPNNRVLLGANYCLVVLVLLVYVICASITTEGTIKQGLTVLQKPHSVCSSHIFKMSDFKDQLFTCAGLPSDNIVEFSCGKKLF